MTAPKKMQETERIGGGGMGHGRGPFGGGMVGQKSMDFGPSAKRLVRRLRPQRGKITVIVAAAIIAVAMSAIGPKILGHQARSARCSLPA